MFDIGFWELFILFVIALVVLGPERLPVAARAVGRWAGQARGFVRSMSNELEREVKQNEMAESLRQARESVKQASDELRESTTSLKKAAEDEVSGFKSALKGDDSSAGESANHRNAPRAADPARDMLPLQDESAAQADTPVKPAPERTHGQTTPKAGASAADQKNEQ